MKKNIFVLLLVFLISIGLFSYSLWQYTDKKTFDKPSFDVSTTEGVPVVDDALGYESLDAEGLYSVSLPPRNPTLQ